LDIGDDWNWKTQELKDLLAEALDYQALTVVGVPNRPPAQEQGAANVTPEK